MKKISLFLGLLIFGSALAIGAAPAPNDDISFAIVGRQLHPDVALSFFDFEGHSPFKGDARSKLLRATEEREEDGKKVQRDSYRFTFNITPGDDHFIGWYFSMKQGAVDFSDKTILRFEIKGTPGLPTDCFQMGIRSKNVPGSDNQAKILLSDLGYKTFPTNYTVIELPVEMLKAKEPGLDMALLNDLLIFGIASPAVDIKEQQVWIQNVSWNWNVKKSGKGLLFTLSNLEFDTGKYDIKPSMVLTLDKLIAYLNKEKKTAIRIEGHTDNQGSDQRNVWLSEKRAEAVASYIKTVGKVPHLKISTSGAGPTRPVATNDTDEGRAKNRRVEITVP